MERRFNWPTLVLGPRHETIAVRTAGAGILAAAETLSGIDEDGTSVRLTSGLGGGKRY